MKRQTWRALVLVASLGLAGCASIQPSGAAGGLGSAGEARVAEPNGPPAPFPVDRPFSRFCYWC